MKSARVLAATTVVALAAGPLAGAAYAVGAPVYTKADSGHTEQLTKGTVFKVRLKNCADCGDIWRFKTRFDSSLVKLVRVTKTSSAKPPAVGGIDTDTWTYKVIGKGTTTEQLIQRSPSNKVISRFSLTIKSGHITVQ